MVDYTDANIIYTAIKKIHLQKNKYKCTAWYDPKSSNTTKTIDIKAWDNL
jgi:hypothetical protein